MKGDLHLVWTLAEAARQRENLMNNLESGSPSSDPEETGPRETLSSDDDMLVMKY
jgi:hypothetical protein